MVGGGLWELKPKKEIVSSSPTPRVRWQKVDDSANTGRCWSSRGSLWNQTSNNSVTLKNTVETAIKGCSTPFSYTTSRHGRCIYNHGINASYCIDQGTSCFAFLVHRTKMHVRCPSGTIKNVRISTKINEV